MGGGSESESDALKVNQLTPELDNLQTAAQEPSADLNPDSQESVKKKKKKKKSKKKEFNEQTDSPSVPVTVPPSTRVTEQTNPPSIPVLDLFPTGEFPEGEIQQYKDEYIDNY